MSDMCYVGVATYDGYKHFQLVQDESSRYLWGFLMKQKADATEIVLHTVIMVLNIRGQTHIFRKRVDW